MRRLSFAIVLALAAGDWAAGPANSAPAADEASGCLKCHRGIEPIRQAGSEMLEEILAAGASRGDKAGCVVCHGGDPSAEDQDAAHGGNAFYPEPGSPWVNEQTCGLCHPDHVRVQWHGLMMTEAGKIQGTAWAFGIPDGYEHKWANYDVANPADKSRRLGTVAYRSYMEHLATLEPGVFVEKHERLPDATSDPAELTEDPKLAAFTYLRNQCLRCHHAVKGRQERGDYRGMGCSSCHIPYGNEGLYEGGDESIPRDRPGHGLVHTIQATRDAKVEVHGRSYSGIPVETCTTCHNRSKRIGVSFQGLMETAYTSPFDERGRGQPPLHTKHYIPMHEEIHCQIGMLCQDCHTSIDVHGSGFLAAANLGAVEIECSDCHGTPNAYPWELPLGYMDEFDGVSRNAPLRGTADRPLAHAGQGTVYPGKDGYLISARGNPLGNAVRDGNLVTVHTAGGKDIQLKPLKLIAEEKSLGLEGLIAMQAVRGHMEKMECYTCHADWAPQSYGRHVKIDYSAGNAGFDWLAAGRRHMQPERRRDRGESGYDTTLPGRVEEQRSFLRWEDPPLGVNGEGRITPVAPGCQVSATLISKDGGPILLNHIFRTPPGSEGAGDDGQLSIDVSPLNPHTASNRPRSCESCHASEKALGYGIGGGRLTRRPDKPTVVDLRTADGHVLSTNARTQVASVEGLGADWSRFVSDDGRQLQTLGHHFSRSRPLNNEERSHVDRRGVCLSCHQEIPEGSLAVSFLHHVAQYADQIPKTREEHNSLLHKILLLAGWVQLAGGAGGAMGLIGGIIWYWRRRKRRLGRLDTASESASTGGDRAT